MSQIQNIPELRFPEFDGEWKEEKLGQLAKIERGKFSPRPRNNPIYYNGNIPFVQTGDVVHSKGIINTYSQTLNEKGLAVSKKFKKGTILITIAANIGYSGVLQQDMACPDSLIGITCGEEINNYFLNYVFSIEQRKMDYLAVAAAQKNINIDFLKPYKIISPSLQEQQKITTFLTSVDKRIQALEQKKELLEQYKKGVMQKIFSLEVRFQPGTVTHHLPLVAEPTTIYNSNNTYPDWEVKKLGEIGEFQTSSVDKLTKEDEKKVFLVNYMNVYRHETINNETIKDFQIVSASDNQLISNNLKKGDILFTPSSETPTDIGHSVVMFEDIENAVYSYHLIRFRPNVNIDILYSHYFCNNPTILRQLSRYATGSTRFTISVKNFSNVTVELPCLEEQQKIAGFLSALDTKIEAVTSHINHSKTFKKGLLQKMFV